MDFAQLEELPTVGWICLLIIALVAMGIIVILLFYVAHYLRKHDIKTPFLETKAVQEITEKSNIQQRELLIAEGKDQLDNQCQVAKQILKEIRIKLYKTALNTFEFKDPKDLVIMELITYRIVDRLCYDVKNDLTRNHITKKTQYELEQYTRAKARGYSTLIRDRLFIFNDKLPDFDLPKIMEVIQPMEIETLFKDIYFSARRIVGSCGDTEKKADEKR